jgi:hypothetical protein
MVTSHQGDDLDGPRSGRTAEGFPDRFFYRLSVGSLGRDPALDRDLARRVNAPAV